MRHLFATCMPKLLNQRRSEPSRHSVEHVQSSNRLRCSDKRHITARLVSIAASFLSFDYCMLKYSLFPEQARLHFSLEISTSTCAFACSSRGRQPCCGGSSIHLPPTSVPRPRITHGRCSHVRRTIASEWKAIPAQDLWQSLLLYVSLLFSESLSCPNHALRRGYSVTTYASSPLRRLSLYTQPNNHLFHTFLVHVVYVLFGNRPGRCVCQHSLQGYCWFRQPTLPH